VAEGGLSTGDVLVLNGFLHYSSLVAAYLSYNTDVFEAGESVVY